MKYIESQEITTTLNELYSNPESPVCFVGRDKLWYYVKTYFYGILYVDVQKFLKSHPVAQIHTRDPEKEVVRPITSKHVNERWGIDLMDFQNHAWWNSNYNYILSVIDFYSRYLWTIPIKDKTAESIVIALEPLIQHYYPKIIQSDNGGEFVNKLFNEMCRRNRVRHVTGKSYSPNVNGRVERVQGTIKSRLKKYLTNVGYNGQSKVWINVLPNITNAYNHTYHSVIKTTPYQAFNKYVSVDKQNQEATKKIQTPLSSPKLHRGDLVRISLTYATAQGRKNMMFAKDNNNWSEEVYTIKHVSNDAQPIYVLEGKKGKFYQYQLHHVLDIIEPIKIRVKETKYDREMAIYRRNNNN